VSTWKRKRNFVSVSVSYPKRRQAYSEPEPEIESEHKIESVPETHSENEIEYASMLNPLSRNLSPSMPNISQTNTDGAQQTPVSKNVSDSMSTVVDPPSAELELSQRVNKNPLFVRKNPPRDRSLDPIPTKKPWKFRLTQNNFLAPSPRAHGLVDPDIAEAMCQLEVISNTEL
jgi:hypothetical protein